MTNITKKAVFVDLNQDFYDRHGIYALSASLKQSGISTDYICSTNHEFIIKELLKAAPQLVMYSSFSHSLNAYKEFDALMKEKVNVMSIIGGAGATFNPAYIDNTTINAACIGEGDNALPEFILNDFKSSGNIHLRGSDINPSLLPLVNMDSLPFPDRKVIYERDRLRARVPSKQFISGRGCPYLCTYCFNHSYNNLMKGRGDIIRKKSVEYICEEVLLVKKDYPLSMLVFNDDTFILNREWLFDFADKYPAKIGIPYSCNIRANLVREDIIQALKESGCVAVNWSIETGDETYRNKVLKRNITDEQILNTAELLNRYGINHRIGNLIGLPGETEEQTKKTIEINIKAKATCSLVNIFVPYPGLDLTEYAKNAGYCQETSEDNLPKNYFDRSSMNISPENNVSLRHILYVFPIITKFPVLYFNKTLNSILFKLPLSIVRLIYEFYYGYIFRKTYRVKSDILSTLQLFLRHFKSIFN